MKSIIRAVTIIIVLALIPAASATAQNSAGSVSRVSAGEYDELLAPHSIDPLVQLRTLLSTTNQQSGGGKVLVIPTAEIKPQDMVTLMEDMTVMCRIFDKKLAQSNLIPGMPFTRMPFIGRMMTFPSLGDRSMGAIYVQGYGALFMTTVDFPLSPPQTEQPDDAEEEDADPVWEQMKQEMFSPQEAARYTPNRQGEQYDARKVKNLKSTLIKALVHTANIRGLKSDELVILTVTGRGISSPTALTIRAKKSYIDALAQNKIDFDEFEEKVQLLLYPCLGENLSRGLPPSFPTGGLYGGSSSDRRRSRSRSGGTDAMEGSGIDETDQSSSDRRRGR